MNIVEYFIKITGNGKAYFEAMKGGFGGLASQTDKTNKQLQGLGAAFRANQFTQALQGMGEALNTINQPAIKMESAMAELSAVTGVSGEELQAIEEKARNLGKVFGAGPAEAAEAYTDILSRLGPEVAKNPQALDAMGKSVLTLSKTMKGDVNGAMDALTTAMLQYNVSMDDPMKASEQMSIVMNQMAQGAQLGSAQVPQVAESFKVAGGAAYAAGLQMSETNAAIQVLGKGSLYGAEAGTKLRNILLKMGEGRFLPKQTQEELIAAGVNIEKLGDKTIPLAERLKELGKAQGDTALMSQLFGAENVVAAQTLLQNQDVLKEWTTQMIGSNAANEQAAIIMNTTAERVAKMKAKFTDLLITVGSYTAKFAPILNATYQFAQVGAQLSPLIGMFRGVGVALLGPEGGLKRAAKAGWGFVKSLAAGAWQATIAAARYAISAASIVGGYVVSLISATAAQIGLNVAMTANPIGLIIVGIAAIGVAVYGIIKHWDRLKGWIWEFGRFVIKYSPFGLMIRAAEAIFPGFMDKVSGWFDTIKGWFFGLWDKIKKIADAAKTFLGIGEGSGDLGGGAISSVVDGFLPQSSDKQMDIMGSKDGGGLKKMGGLQNDSEAIVGGGKKSTNITINLKNLVEQINIYPSSKLDISKGIEDEVLKALTRVLSVAQGQVV